MNHFRCLVRIRAAAAAGLALLLAACSLASLRPPPLKMYDFGVAPGDAATVHSRLVIAVPEMLVPSALESTAIGYRLAYNSSNQPRTYGDSQWTMPPGELLSQRIRARFAAQYVVASLAQTRHDVTLSLQLEEFSQIFDAADRSHAQLRLRATLLKNDGTVLAQTTLNEERPAASPDAAGGVGALVQVSDAAADALLLWVRDNLS